MRWPLRLGILALLSAAAAVACQGGGPTPPLGQPEIQPGDVVIFNGTLIDGTGAEPVLDGYVVVRHERILSVGSGAPQIPSGARLIDAQGGTILPGLFDAHVHITSEILGAGAQPRLYADALLPWLQSGVTTLRDVGASWVLFPSYRQFVEPLTEQNKAPRVVWAGPIMTAIGGYPMTVPFASVGQEVASADEARQLVYKLADDGARIIKLGLEQGYYSDEGWPLLSLDEVKVITEAAHERGLLVTAHVTSVDEVRLAIDGGVDDLAHTPLEPLPDEVIEQMLERRMGMVTTATIWGGPDSPDLQAGANVKRYIDAGGTVALGTDFGCCGQAPGMEPLLQEMELLLRAGLTPMQVIVAATKHGAEVSNLGDELGTIEPGKLADIIVVDGDPLIDIRAMRDVTVVIKGGQIVVETVPTP